tara:strand:+ start:1423 stop:2031 length:609 start_codon:yes stop_codon:yes gene_type:complete
MLVIGNSAVDTTQGKSWIYQIADKKPKTISTVSNEHTYKIFLAEQTKHEQIAIVMNDFVHQQIGNIVYNWSNDHYLDINHTRRRDMVMMSHTPDTLVNHNKLWYDSIKLIRPDCVVLTEWARSEFSIVEKIVQSKSDELYNKYSLSDQFIRWCGIHQKDTKKFGILDGLVNDSEYYTEDFEYSDKGNVAIAELYESARSSVG